MLLVKLLIPKWDPAAVHKISRNHRWSNGPPTLVAFGVVRSMLGGPLKIQVNFKLSHHWYMDVRMVFFCGLHTIVLEIDFKQNESIKENFNILWWKKSWSPNGPLRWISRSSGRFISHLGWPGHLLFYTLQLFWLYRCISNCFFQMRWHMSWVNSTNDSLSIQTSCLYSSSKWTQHILGNKQHNRMFVK